MSYIKERVETKKRITVDIERFVADLCQHLGPAAYLARRPNPKPYTGLSNIRFRGQDYELEFEAGTGMAAGPGRVWIACQLVDGHGPWLETMSVGAHRPMRDIAAFVKQKILDRIDELKAPASPRMMLHQFFSRDGQLH